MRFSKLYIVIASLVTTLTFTGCSNYEQALITNAVTGNTHSSSYGNPYYYNGYNYGNNRDNYYQYGVKDGCRTSQRGYTVKNNHKWNNYSSYRSGWYAGKRQCRRNYTNNNSSRNYYNKGYSDGCYSKKYRGTRKNRSLYDRNRGNYRKGWRNGYRECRRRY